MPRLFIRIVTNEVSGSGLFGLFGYAVGGPDGTGGYGAVHYLGVAVQIAAAVGGMGKVVLHGLELKL